MTKVHPRRRPRLASHRNQRPSPDLNVPATAPYFSRPANRASLAPCLRLEERQHRLPRRAGPDAHQPTHARRRSYFFETAVHQHTITGTPALSNRSTTRPGKALVSHPRTLPQPRRQEHARRRLEVSASLPASASTTTTPQSRCFPTATSSPPSTTRPTAKTTPIRPSCSSAAAPALKTGTCPNRSPSSPTPASPHPSSGTIRNSKRNPGQHLDVLGIRSPHRRPALRLRHLERQRRHLVRRALPRLPAAHRPLRLAAHQLHRPRSRRHDLHAHRLHRPGLRRQRLHLRRLEVHRRRPDLVRHRRPHRRPPHHHRLRPQRRPPRLRRQELQHRRPHAARHLARRRQNVDQIQTPLRPPRQRRTSHRHSPL